MSGVKYPFSRELRLLTPEQFTFVFQQSVKASRPEISIIARANHLGFSRLGLTIAKKHVKRAVVRNRIKRVCRDYFRRNQHTLPAMDFIVIARKGLGEMDNKQLFEVLDILCNRHRRLARNA